MCKKNFDVIEISICLLAKAIQICVQHYWGSCNRIPETGKSKKYYWRAIRVISVVHEAARSIATLPGWDASPSQVTPQHLCQVSPTIRRYPFILLVGESHCESSFSRTETFLSATHSAKLLASHQTSNDQTIGCSEPFIVFGRGIYHLVLQFISKLSGAILRVVFNWMS